MGKTSEYECNKNGGYDGGGGAADMLTAVGKWADFLNKFGNEPQHIMTHYNFGICIVVLLMLAAFLVFGGAGFVSAWFGKPKEITKFSYFTPGSSMGFASELATEGFNQSRAEGAFDMLHKSGFAGSREEPYFSDVPNSTLQSEDRTREAIRTLSKINQERLRRAAADPNAPLEWEPYYKEWEKTHPLDTDNGGVEGYENPMDGLKPY